MESIFLYFFKRSTRKKIPGKTRINKILEVRLNFLFGCACRKDKKKRLLVWIVGSQKEKKNKFLFQNSKTNSIQNFFPKFNNNKKKKDFFSTSIHQFIYIFTQETYCHQSLHITSHSILFSLFNVE